MLPDLEAGRLRGGQHARPVLRLARLSIDEELLEARQRLDASEMLRRQHRLEVVTLSALRRDELPNELARG